MGAQVIILPVVARPPFNDPAWREQYDRECRARCEELIAPPPRTRPILITTTARQVRPDNFEAVLREIQREISREEG